MPAEAASRNSRKKGQGRVEMHVRDHFTGRYSKFNGKQKESPPLKVQ